MGFFFPTNLRHRSHRNKNDIFIHVGFNSLKELSDKGIPSPVERVGGVSHGEFPEMEIQEGSERAGDDMLSKL